VTSWIFLARKVENKDWSLMMKFFPFILPLFCLMGLCSPTSASPSGPLPQEFASWTEMEKSAQRVAGQQMLQQIRTAIETGEKNILIPNAHYRFAENSGGKYPAHIIFPKDMDGVTVDFQGSTLWFETHASGMVLPGSINCTIRNVFLDWDPLPFMQGTVVAMQPDADTFDVKIDPGYEHPVSQLKEESWRGRGVVFDPETRELKEGQRGCEVTFSWAKRNADGSYRLKFHGFHGIPFSQSGIQVGDPYVMLKRMQRAVRMEGTRNCTLDGVTLYAAPFIGFVHSAGSAPTFRNCGILRRPDTNRLMAGNADGINCDNLEKGPLIEGCRMETIGDDFVNIHGHLGRVIWQEEDGAIITTRLNRRSSVSEPVEVEFLERTTMRSLGKRKATWEALDWKVDASRSLADIKHRWHSGDAAGLQSGKTVPASRLKLDEPLKIDGDIVVICESFSGSGAVIRGNHFKGSLARGLRLHSPHVVIENNTISTTLGQGISLTSQAAFWGEGPYVYDAVVRNNTLERIGLGGSEPVAALQVQATDKYQDIRLPRNIRIENNSFAQIPGAAIILRGVDDVVVQDNTINGFALRQPTPGAPANDAAGAAIVLDSIRGLALKNNTITGGGPGALKEPILQINNP